MATRTITKRFEVNGVLTDVTTAKLSDPTGTYGVKRNDTNAVVVADGTDMASTATGIYSYSFTYVEGVAYTAYVEIVYEGATYHFEVDIEAVTTSVTGTTYSDVQVEIADFLGWTRDRNNWSSDETARLSSIINAGYRQFIYAPIAPGETVQHRWSFLQPTATFDTVAGTYLYDLPATFGAMIGDLVYDEDEDVHRIIEQTNPGMIDRNRAVDDSQGRPYLFALRPKGVAQTAEQVTELMLFPTPDAVYGIVYHYDAKVVTPSSVNAYFLGGQAHSETIMQSCRDIAATRYKDNPGSREHDLFLERLKASIESDRRLSPKTLGENNDGQRIVYTRHGTEFSVSLTHNLGGG